MNTRRNRVLLLILALLTFAFTFNAVLLFNLPPPPEEKKPDPPDPPVTTGLSGADAVNAGLPSGACGVFQTESGAHKLYLRDFGGDGEGCTPPNLTVLCADGTVEILGFPTAADGTPKLYFEYQGEWNGVCAIYQG